MSSILIVEDEGHIAAGLKFNLEADGHDVEVLEDGEAALERLAGTHAFDLVVLDVMLPGVDGFEVAATLRARREYVPILMLTARSRPEDVLRGFEAGADDYLPKPFELAILLARVRGLLRRTEWLGGTRPRADIWHIGDKTIDFETLEVRGEGETVHLTAMEADLLRYLIRSEGRVVSRKEMLQDLWGLHEDTDTRAIDNFVVRLRRYLELEPTKPKHLVTVRGVGYRFLAEP